MRLASPITELLTFVIKVMDRNSEFVGQFMMQIYSRIDNADRRAHMRMSLSIFDGVSRISYVILWLQEFHAAEPRKVHLRVII